MHPATHGDAEHLALGQRERIMEAGGNAELRALGQLAYSWEARSGAPQTCGNAELQALDRQVHTADARATRSTSRWTRGSASRRPGAGGVAALDAT